MTAPAHRKEGSAPYELSSPPQLSPDLTRLRSFAQRLHLLRLCAPLRPPRLVPAVLSTHDVDKRLDVARGEGASAVAPGRVVHHARHVVVNDESVESDVLELPD